MDLTVEIFAYVAGALTCGEVPRFGTREWAELDDADPAKQAAVVRAALAHWGAEQLAMDAMVQASHAISEAGDWGAVAYRVRAGQ